MTGFAGNGRLAAVALAVALTACGGGGGSAPSGSASCDVASQNAWLRGYMRDWYFWASVAPNPDPAGYTTVQDYFNALLYPGDTVVPKDRWSYIEDSARYNQFFGEGKTLGYGMSVNGLELTLPLKVRYVDPGSPAAAAGLKRGDVIDSINGRTSAELIAANDFAALTPGQAGDVLTVVIETTGGTKTVALTATTYDLVPVPTSTVVTLGNGTKAGYLVLKDFITQAETPLANALAQFRAAGATELIVDLRYNGGGRVSTATLLASLISGAGRNGAVFARLSYNAQHAGSNNVFTLSTEPGPAFSRVVIITGTRTCSASELLVNGLKPYADVVTIGGTTCGKPFGFNPVESCGSTYSVVNFETVNALGDGRYYNGIAATCPISDDFSGELGDPAEKLTAAAESYLQTGVCPPPGAAAQSSPFGRKRGFTAHPGDRIGRRME